jgi:serine/threonine protein phosphatase PrpC
METLQCEVGAASDVGVVRLNNEDAYVCDSDTGLFLVCDGMGGEQAGEVASQLAAQSILSVVRSSGRRRRDEIDDFFAPLTEGDALQARSGSSDLGLADGACPSREGELLRFAINAANREIHVASQSTETQHGMGTTVAAVLITDNSATIAHAGDSRVYLLRNGSVELLTNDHSVVAEQVRAGAIPKEMVPRSPYQNYLTRALGPSEEVQPDVREISVHDGDLFLLTTDGLTGPVSEEEIRDIIDQCLNLTDACLLLVDQAKRNGSTDNITCVLVRVQLMEEAGQFAVESV